ncbi:MAG: polymerase protein [Parcubacteria group bacterium GW2011_GWB2_40_8]|nr:MAG: polymerase protein [Parcubacteria group bacterium GW2011_GWF2_40_10]KKR75267.1 MAG: polymerase protein [Parcubacteria group bacterium GW2011_GWB2_40_8]
MDAHAILHRAFHALPDFTSPNGEPTGALYGFTAFLIKVIRELKPDYIAACYDLPEPTFRHVAYKNYKAGRAKMDDALAKQINRSRDILKNFNIPVYDAPGFEADDVLGTIVEKVKSQKSKIKTIVASGDMDTLQLVSGNDVVVYTLRKGIQDTIVYNDKTVKERYGFGPKLVPDFKALKGDPSDNILGVPGIGDKTATELIVKYGNIENLYKKLKKGEVEAKPRILKLLEENEEEAEFSKTLAEIRKDAPIKFNLEDTEWKNGFSESEVRNIFDELGFRSLAARLFNQKTEEKAGDATRGDTTPVGNGDVVDDLKERFKKVNSELPEKLYKEVEIPLIKILEEMQETGILLDVKYLEKLSAESHKELTALEKKIWKMADEEFNISSPKQMGQILFEKLNLAAGNKIKKTATGAYSTNISELTKLKGKHPIIDEIIFYRELSKLVSTYIDALPKLADKNNRLHTTFDQAGTATGRISSQEPNLQNIPKRSDKGKEVRRAFVSDKGFKLVAFDYSQVELRVAAILSGDEKLIEVFKKDEDVHAAVASEVFGVTLAQVTPEMRRVAKVIDFGIIYGMGINALRQNIGCSKEEAQKFYNEYFKKFAGVAKYMEKIKKEVYVKGCTETLFGRKRFFPEIKSHMEYVRKEAERMAINAPIQGTAADMVKMAMVAVNRALEKEGFKGDVKMLLQIHDELLFEIKEEKIKVATPIIIEAMEGVYKGEVPIKVNAEIGDNWDEMVLTQKRQTLTK